ncbi:hypothetical protein DM2_1722 [Halorubrum sp. DM2]|nr:hypothetical protein DM2_1722 [Halorubrum sp. DM2]
MAVAPVHVDSRPRVPGRGRLTAARTRRLAVVRMRGPAASTSRITSRLRRRARLV